MGRAFDPGLNGCSSNGKVSYGSLGDMLEKGEYPFQALHDHSLGKIMENTYMLHVVCTEYCLWLFSVIAAPKLSRYLKSTWAIAPSKLVLFLLFFWLGGIVKKLWSINSDCSWVLMVMLSRTVYGY